ncbi:RNA polymerase II subunit A C-terminal domain phosphatase SSU72-like [Homarus americanus]|uniref:RNA polymerase II subunit A C-terminal domain phosphatase SSU72 n=1 Tax=Homarus americanus TaxID=6706 RepID=A0A8J5JKX0_HOMAM|nr:RNA polymerase II subunit A C-terminal domain phosphatase SSU72-like [Homarus americanus]
MAELGFAVTCSSNMNRSMEAHAFLSKKGFNVRSFGTGDKVKLPGPAPDKPNCYEFGTSYDDIYNDLLKKDKTLYTQNGLLHMLDRNRRIKPEPERFQVCKEKFDIIITCEERVYDQDNHEEATIGAFMICELAALLSGTEDLDNDIDELLHEFETKCQRNVLHCVQFY